MGGFEGIFRGVKGGKKGCFDGKRVVFRAFLGGMGWGILVGKGPLGDKAGVILWVKNVIFCGVNG